MSLPEGHDKVKRVRQGVPHKLWLLCSGWIVALVLWAGPANHASAQTSIQESFRLAAERWNVPVGLLMAIGYIETRWEHQVGLNALDGGVGIMHLTPGKNGTLTRAAQLTGRNENELNVIATANIDGAAAVLGDISLEFKNEDQERTRWMHVLAQYSGFADERLASAYSTDVLEVWQQGRSLITTSGERVTLVGDDSVETGPPGNALPLSEDYPPALWVPAHSGNYSSGRQYGPLSFIIVHDTEGSYYSAINWFQNPNSQVSAHYVIRSSDGQITQMVRDANTAWHAGNWDYNVRSFGIEHEGYMNQPGWYTEAMYQSSAALSRHLSERHGLRKDRGRIIAHSEVPGSTHLDPGPYWNWNRYMSLVRRDWAFSDRVDNTDADFDPIPPEIDPQHYWWTHGGGYGGSNSYVTTSVANEAQSVNSGTWITYLPNGGYYDVYAFIPWVDNNTPETSSARYKIYARDGEQIAVISQRAITDRGTGGWAHLGPFYFDANAASRVSLSDYTGEAGRNVWFDAVMWIPREGGGPPPPPPAATATRTPTRTHTPTRAPTSTRVPTMPPTATVGPTWTPGACGMLFTDLPDTDWSYNYVSYLYCLGVMGGYDDGTFRPHVDSMRGQIVKILALGLGWNLYNPVAPTFSDVQPGSTFYAYVETAHIRGVVGGYEDGTFRPNNPVTRGQAAKMVVSAKGWPPLYPPTPSFSDVPPANWAYGFVEAALERQIIGGYPDGTFRPHLHVTRSQLAKIIALALQSAARPGDRTR